VTSSAGISAASAQLTQLSLAPLPSADLVRTEGQRFPSCPIGVWFIRLHGFIKQTQTFPIDYPYSPPTFRFLTKMWHPNIYENGDVCISILHPPVDDPQSGELPSERWNPTQNVRTILLSVISLLNEPNTFSPANVDASVMFRKWRDSKGKDKELIAELAETSF
uniref:UBC core domain-containing protein n=1 Tax=Anser cygnoides TaxID=8845 RepID=A0A8B9IQZ2_ANSCY